MRGSEVSPLVAVRAVSVLLRRRKFPGAASVASLLALIISLTARSCEGPRRGGLPARMNMRKVTGPNVGASES